jgi:hypothetical protein
MGIETDFARRVDKFLKSKEGLWFLNTYGNAVQRAGIPDRLVCYKGVFIGLELKRPDGKGKESVRQQIEGSKIQQAGGIYRVVESIEEIEEILRNV